MLINLIIDKIMMIKKILLFAIFIIVITYSQNMQFKIKGFLKDYNNLNNIEDALIYNKDIYLGRTNGKGYFEIVSSEFIENITVKKIGYKNCDYSISFVVNKFEYSVNILLIANPIEIEKVTINGEKYNETYNSKIYSLQLGDFKRIPSFVESDAMRAIQALPGVNIASDMGSQLYLRGGNYDETMISIDGVELFNPYHLGGLFSVFNTDYINKINLYPSSYPINYSGYLSGVVDISTKDGNYEQYKGAVSLGLLSSKFFAEIPILKGSLVLSARRSYLDILGIFNTDFSLPYSLFDFYAKYTLPLSDNSLFKISYLFSRDNYSLTEDANANEIIKKNEPAKWGNSFINLQYNHFWTNSDFGINISKNNYYLNSDLLKIAINDFNAIDTIIREKVFIDNKIETINIKFDFNYTKTAHKLSIGANYKKIVTSNNWDIGDNSFNQYFNETGLESVFYDYAESKHTSSGNENIINAFINYNLNISRKISLQTGVSYTNLLLNKLNYFATNFKIKYKIANNIETSFHYGKYYQPIYTKRESIQLSGLTPFSVYFISNDKNYLPNSNHYSINLNINEIDNNYEFDLEVYLKDRYNIPSTFEVTKEIKYLNGYSIGLDLLIRKKKGDLTGWINYSFGRSIKKDSEHVFYANYDRTHSFKAVFNYELNKNWSLSGYWTYASGLPYTALKGKYIRDINEMDIVYGNKNAERFYPTHRLDIGITGNFIWAGYLFQPYLQIMNVYNSENVFQYIPTKESDQFERGSQIIPTIGISMEF